MKAPEHYISQAEYVQDLKVDICFLIHDNFYYDDESIVSEEEAPWKKQMEFLKRPTFPLHENCCALSSDVEGNEQSLVTYYDSILDNAKQHNKTLAAGDSCFWLNPIIFKDNSKSIGFPHHTTFADAVSFLSILQSNEDGCIFDEQDLDWHLAVYTEKEKIYFVCAWFDECFEQEEPYWCVSNNRAAFVEMSKAVLKRVEKQINILSQRLGKDYWTRVER